MEVHLTVAGGKGSGDVDRCGGSSPKVLPRRDGAGARARLFLLPACDPPRGRCPGGHRSVDPTLSRPGRVPAPVSAPLGSSLSRALCQSYSPRLDFFGFCRFHPSVRAAARAHRPECGTRPRGLSAEQRHGSHFKSRPIFKTTFCFSFCNA